MSNDYISVTLPLTQQGLNVIVVAVFIAIVTGVIWLALSVSDSDRPDPARRALEAFGWVYAPIWMIVFAGTLWALWQVFSGGDSPLAADGFRSLGLGALIAALLGAPFVIWGTVLKQKNTEIQNRLADLSDASLFNDKLAEAVDALYSRRQVTRVTKQNDAETVHTEWEDDILKRSAAIDRLENLVIERRTEAARVASMLSLYVRELSRQQPPKIHVRSQFLKLLNPDDDSMPLEFDEALHELRAHPDQVELEEFKRWASEIMPWRADVEKATQVLGRMNAYDVFSQTKVKLNLKRSNLQGFDLSGLDFSGADFSDLK